MEYKANQNFVKKGTYFDNFVFGVSNKASLIAPCGMNCGVCMAYLREKNKCFGCRAVDIVQPITRVRCKIKNCEVFKKGKSKYCFKCKNIPCERLKHLDKRYRAKYSMSMLDNLEYIKKFGIRKFVRKEKIRWACPNCGGTICVHTRSCHNCEEIIK